jgi:hypothetical protein
MNKAIVATPAEEKLKESPKEAATLEYYSTSIYFPST